jgi:integrase
MSVVKRKAGFSLALQLSGKQYWVATQAPTKTRARELEAQILTAWRSQDFRALDPEARSLMVKLHENHGWAIPTDLIPETKKALTLWDAVQSCLRSDRIRESNRERVEQCFFHIVSYFGENFPLSDLWIPQIRKYLQLRHDSGAAASTVNKEKAALSIMFQHLMESRVVDANPARMVKAISEKDGQRDVYVSHADFCLIVDHLPAWFRPVAWTAYYTGMRRGEILRLTRDSLDLNRRLITLRPADTKERDWKRIPIHRELVPIIEEALSGPVSGLRYVFLKNGAPILDKDQVRWCWDRRVDQLEELKGLRFHDLRHTWKTNARRSGIIPEITEAILGHSTRARSVSERYGHISDEELVQAVDSMTFDHGETVIRGKLRGGNNGERSQDCGVDRGLENIRRARPEHSSGPRNRKMDVGR